MKHKPGWCSWCGKKIGLPRVDFSYRGERVRLCEHCCTGSYSIVVRAIDAEKDAPQEPTVR